MKNIMWPISSRNIECDKPQGTICKGPKGILTIVLEPIRAFFLGPKWLLRTQIFEKKGKISSEKKTMWPIFSRIIECGKSQGTIFKGPKAILTITVDLIRAFFRT